jgi:hypothetical protein
VTDKTVDGQAYRGVSIGRNASPSLSGNIVCDCGTNLWVAEQAEPQLGDNEICEDEPAA